MTFFGTNITKFRTQAIKSWSSLIKPYIMTTFAIGTSVTTGDFICQYIESHKKDPNSKTITSPSSAPLSWWNPERSRIMLTTAIFVSTPWSFTLARTVERLFPGKQGIQIAKKIVTQTLMGSINICLVFTSIVLLQGHSLRVAKEKIKNDMPKTFVVGSCYWPFVSFINFRFIPLNYRPTVGSLAGALWNIYVSSAAHNPKFNPNGTGKSITKTETTSMTEKNETGVSPSQETMKTLDNRKKDR